MEKRFELVRYCFHHWLTRLAGTKKLPRIKKRWLIYPDRAERRWGRGEGEAEVQLFTNFLPARAAALRYRSGINANALEISLIALAQREWLLHAKKLFFTKLCIWSERLAGAVSIKTTFTDLYRLVDTIFKPQTHLICITPEVSNFRSGIKNWRFYAFEPTFSARLCLLFLLCFFIVVVNVGLQKE